MFSRLIVLALFALPTPLLANPVSVSGRAALALGALHPAISPDGKQIAVSYQGSIGIVPANGGTLQLLSKGAGWDLQPTWSPNGKWIAYLSAPSFRMGSVHIINAETGEERAIPKRVSAMGKIEFHPDGKRIVGKLIHRGVPVILASMDIASGDVKQVSGYENVFGRRRATHALSHDGKSFFFTEQFEIAGEQGGFDGPQADVYRIPLTGGKPEKLFQWPARIYGMTSTKDGLYLVTDRGTAHNDIWFLPGKEPLRGARKLTFGIADEDAPSTSGALLAYTDNRHGATTLVVQDRAGVRREVRINKIDFGTPTKRMIFRLPKGKDTATEAWRYSVKRKNGKYHSPPGSMYHISAGLGHFVHRGDLEIELPVGDYEVRIFRGPEFHADLTNITLFEKGETQIFHGAITRWIDMRKQGWYSGENHIHANYGYGSWYNTPRSIFDMCEAEDLHVNNLVVANSDGDAVFDREFFLGKPDPLSTSNTLLWWNEEYRSTLWGHMTLFHLKQLVEPIFTGFKNTTNPWDIPTNGEVARRTRLQNGVASYTHPTNNKQDPYEHAYSGKGLPVDAALGLIDCIDLMGVVYDNALPFWYQFLNAGIRLPAAAGTDCFLNRVYMAPPGWGRVYVHLPDGFDYAEWCEGVKQGRSFVSNGPMLNFTAEGKQLGDTIRLNAPGKIAVKGDVRSKYPLEALEVVFNGKVVESGRLDEQNRNGMIKTEISVESSGWVALRAAGKPVRFWQGRSHSAHTNPIWVHVTDRPMDTSKSARYFLKWIDRLEAHAKKRDRVPEGEWADVQKHLDLARAVYRSKLKFSSVIR